MNKRRFTEYKYNADNWRYEMSMFDEPNKVFIGFTYSSLLDVAPSGCLKNIPLYVAIKTRMAQLTKALLQGDYYIDERIFQMNDNSWCNDCPEEQELTILHHEECPDAEFGVTESERNRVMRARDIHFNFDKIYSSSDDLNAQPIFYRDEHSVEAITSYPFYNGLTFIEVYNEDPQYIINMIRNNHLYVEEDVIYQVSSSLPLYDKLVNAVKQRIAR